MKAFESLRSALNAVTDTSRVPNEIRICLELVQTCHNDLQDLISLRNDNLRLLEAAPPQILERLNNVIKQANDGLATARCIVEKCRPEAHRGNKTPLYSQFEWVWRSSSEFRCQEPLLSRHHAAVLAELNFLRQVTTWAMVNDSTARIGHIPTLSSSPHEFNTIASATVSSMPRAWTPHSGRGTPSTPDAKMIEYADFPELLFPDAPVEIGSSTDSLSLASARRATSWSPNGRQRAASTNAVVNSSHNRDMSRLFND